MDPENQEDITHMTDTAMLPDDEQAKKFKELANKRVNDICKRLRNLGNLANPRIYHYTPEQICTYLYVLIAWLSCRMSDSMI